MPDGLPLRPEDPAELGGHRILRRLGEGNQGVVYLGLSPSGEHVAIKLLHARMAEDPGARERFVRELSAAKKVARFCTAQVLDADLAGDHPYIVSEYVEGHSLRSHIIKQGPRTGGALERLAIGTLTALAAIHKAGIVHRDFTPHNVLLGPDGPRVIDFGIARALGAVRNDETNSVGTPSYMAPEQVSGREIGPPADMFAWGSTILFAGTGRPPFGNEAVHAVMERIMGSEPDVSALPEPLRSVVAACLAKDPAQRPTAQQAQAGLLGDEATEALMPPPAFGTSTGPAGPDAGAPGAGFHSPVTPPLGAVSSGLEAASSALGAVSPTARPPAASHPAASHPAADRPAGRTPATPAHEPPRHPATDRSTPAPPAASAQAATRQPAADRPAPKAPTADPPTAPATPVRAATRQPAADTEAADKPSGRPSAGPPASRPPASGPPASGPPDAGPPDAGPPVSGPPVSGPPAAGWPAAGWPASGQPAAKALASGQPAAERTAAEVALPPASARPPAVPGHAPADRTAKDTAAHSPVAPGPAGQSQAGQGGSTSGPFASGGSPDGGPASRPGGGSVLTPAAGSAAVAGRRNPRVGWALAAGAAVVVVGVAVAIPLWPHGGDAATAPKAHAAAVPTTPSPVASVHPTPQMNGIRSGVPKPVKPTKHPGKGCRDYQHVYTMLSAGTIVLKVSICRDVYTGTAVLGDTAPKDGWDICLQLRGHLAGPGPVTYISTILSSRDGHVRAFDNGPKVRFGAKTKRTEDSVTVNAGRCKGSGSRIQTSWQTQEQLPAG